VVFPVTMRSLEGRNHIPFRNMDNPGANNRRQLEGGDTGSLGGNQTESRSPSRVRKEYPSAHSGAPIGLDRRDGGLAAFYRGHPLSRAP
jgi:hypothetical protein